MANHKSALKRVGVSENEVDENGVMIYKVDDFRSVGELYTVKSFDKALASEDKAAVESAYVNAVSTVDKAAGKGVIHKNAANRKKAQLAIKLAAK